MKNPSFSTPLITTISALLSNNLVSAAPLSDDPTPALPAAGSLSPIPSIPSIPANSSAWGKFNECTKSGWFRDTGCQVSYSLGAGKSGGKPHPHHSWHLVKLTCTSKVEGLKYPVSIASNITYDSINGPYCSLQDVCTLNQLLTSFKSDVTDTYDVKKLVYPLSVGCSDYAMNGTIAIKVSPTTYVYQFSLENDLSTVRGSTSGWRKIRIPGKI